MKEDVLCLENILNVPEKDSSVTKEVFKSLRNAVVLNEFVQLFVVAETNLLKYSLEFLQETIANRKDAYWAIGRIVLQFLINLIVGNRKASKAVWNVFSLEFVALLKESKFSYHSSALLYNILRQNKAIMPTSDLVSVLVNKVQEGNEYATFFIEHCVQLDYAVDIYSSLETNDRIVFLEVIKQNLIKIQGDFKLHKNLLLLLIGDFKTKSDCILKTVADYLKQIEPYEVVLLLDILSNISSNDDYLLEIQCDKSLLINCVFLLKSIQELGKIEENNFTIIQKLSEIDVSNENLNQHPAFGFKASLVRLLGNLSWKNKRNQDEVCF